MRVLDTLTATMSFASQATVGDQPYNGDMSWELGDGFGSWTPVDPTAGASNAAATATVLPGGQQLLLNRVADGVPFAVRATYPGAAGSCSVTQRSIDLEWAAPVVYMAPLCVQ